MNSGTMFDPDIGARRSEVCEAGKAWFASVGAASARQVGDVIRERVADLVEDLAVGR